MACPLNSYSKPVEFRCECIPLRFGEWPGFIYTDRCDGREERAAWLTKSRHACHHCLRRATIRTAPRSPDSGRVWGRLPGRAAGPAARMRCPTGNVWSPIRRLVHLLVTAISIVLEPARSADVTSTRYGGAQTIPTDRPLTRTSAISRTLPRSSQICWPDRKHAANVQGAKMVGRADHRMGCPGLWTGLWSKLLRVAKKASVGRYSGSNGSERCGRLGCLR
jgi:hypothetical protein